LTGSYAIASFGDEDTLVEIRESGGTIMDIECIYLVPTLREANLFLPDYRCDEELTETEDYLCPGYSWGSMQSCVVNVAGNRMEIVFNTKIDKVCAYCLDGRVEYYCDDCGELVFIRVSDLTDEEYAAL